MQTAGLASSRRIQMPGSMQPPVNDPLTRQYNLYNTAVEQQAGDYGSIMQGYRDLHGRANDPNSNYNVGMRTLGGYTQSGGYTDEDKADIRARGMSPIRAIYANANRDIDRQKGIQGGYTPNYGAMKAKMARELSFSLGDQMNNINGDLAGRIAGNRVGAAGTFVGASQTGNQAAERALSGMAGLYGTTPALASTFGNQALQGAQIQNQVNQQNTQTGMQGVQQIGSALRRR